MLLNCFKFIKKADLLVDPYEFKIHKGQKAQTQCGGFLTISIILLGVFYVINLVSKQLSSQDTIYAGTQANIESQEKQLGDEEVIFLIGVQGVNNTMYGNLTQLSEYFSITATYIEQVRESEKEGFERKYQEMSVQQCTEDIVESMNFQKNAITSKERQKLICFRGSFTLFGQFYDQLFQYVKLNVALCQPSDTQSCKPLQEIHEFINSGININLFLRDAKVKQSLNITDPAIIYTTSVYWRLTNGIANNEDVFLSPVTVDLSNNLFQLSLQESSKFLQDIVSGNQIQNLLHTSTVNRQERRTGGIDNKYGETTCSFYLRISSESQYYFSLQNDLPTLFLSSVSEAAGLILALIQFIKIFYRFYNKHQMYVKLMNHVFRFEFSKKKNMFECQNLEQCNIRKSLYNFVFEQIMHKKIIYSFFHYLAYNFKKLYRVIKKSNQKMEEMIIISQMAKKKIESDLDLTNLLTKLYQIECLKLFLFDDDQLMLFNTFSSPVFQTSMIKNELYEDLLQSSGGKISRKLNKAFSRSKSSNNDFQIDFDFDKQNMPMQEKLAKVSRFFRSELVPLNTDTLIKVFEKVEGNKNSNIQMNTKLIQFVKSNCSLYNLMKQQIFEKSPSIFVPNELSLKCSERISERISEESQKVICSPLQKCKN